MTQPSSSEGSFLSGLIYVRFKRGVPLKDRQGIVGSLEGQFTDGCTGAELVSSVRVPPGMEDSAVRAFKDNPRVFDAERRMS